jgi:hypothetical protein
MANLAAGLEILRRRWRDQPRHHASTLVAITLGTNRSTTASSEHVQPPRRFFPLAHGATEKWWERPTGRRRRCDAG